MDKEKVIQLKELVLNEAVNIKKHATKEEINNLDFSYLDGRRVHKCIYGQMTGHCHSIRALDLLTACATPYSSLISCITSPNYSHFIDGDRVQDNDFDPDWYTRDFSAIEFYITKDKLCGTHNEWANIEGIQNLVSFLKGEKETLTINDL